MSYDSRIGNHGPVTNTELRATALPVSAASLPLPTGAATDAKLDTIIARLDTLIGHLDGVETKLDAIATALAPLANVKANAGNTGLIATTV